MKDKFVPKGLLGLVLLTLSVSCEKGLDNNEIVSSLTGGTTWEAQLQQALITGNEFLKGSSLKMIGFEKKEDLSSPRDILKLKSILLSDDQVLPDYSPVNLQTLQLISIGDVKNNISVRRHNELDYDIAGTSVFLDSTLKVGQKIVEITWEKNGKPFITRAVVDDQEGIIYDNLISNILVIKEKHTGQGVQAPDNATFSLSECIEMPFPDPDIIPRSKVVAHGWTAHWLWGSERGEASVNHSVEGYTDRRGGYAKQVLTCSSVDAYSYMSLGHGDAQIINHSTSYGVNGSSYVHWGLYLAAPTITVSMTYSPAAGYNFTISGALGSELHHKGSEYISALHFATM